MKKVIITLLSFLSIAHAGTTVYKKCLLSYERFSAGYVIGGSKGIGILTCKGNHREFPIKLWGLSIGFQGGIHERKGCIELENVRIKNGDWDATNLSVGLEVASIIGGSISGGLVFDAESGSLLSFADADGVGETGFGLGGGIAGIASFMEIIENPGSEFYDDVAEADLHSCSYNK